MLGTEEPFSLETPPQLLVGQRQRPDPVGFQRSRVELISAVARIDRHASVQKYLHPVFGEKLEFFGRRAEHHRRDTDVFFFKGKIIVPRAVTGKIGDLAAHPDIGKNRIAVQKHLDVLVQAADT